MRSALAFFRHAQVHSGGAILAAVRSAVAPPLHHVPQPPCPTRWWQSGRSLSSSSSTTRHDDDERGDLAQSRTHVNRSLISLQTDGSEPAAEPGSTVPGTEASAAEVTLYIKGFLSQNESSEEFQDWLTAHRSLQRSPDGGGGGGGGGGSGGISKPTPGGWGAVAMGYSWESGHHADTMLPIAFPLKGLWAHSKLALLPLPTLTMAYTALKYMRRAGSLTPVGLATAASVELAHTVGWQAYRLHRQYKAVHANIHSEAMALADVLDELAAKHKTVRIVGLSLGGLLALEAQKIRSTRLRIAEGSKGHADGTTGTPAGGGNVELYLCGAAVTTSRAAHLLSAIGPLPKVTVFHAPTDKILSVFFSFAEGEPSIGEVGIPKDVLATLPNVQSVDVSDTLETLVHWDYGPKFDRLVQKAAEEA